MNASSIPEQRERERKEQIQPLQADRPLQAPEVGRVASDARVTQQGRSFVQHYR